MPYLEFEHQLRPIGPGVLTLGSGTEAAWRIQGRDLAPLHAILSPGRDGRVVVSRAAAYAPITINGQELAEGRGILSFGDRLQLGQSEFVYRQVARATPSREGFLRDTRRGRVYKLAGTLEIGRDSKCDVLLTEPEVSRVHAELYAREDGYYVCPVGNAYTLVNHNRLMEPVQLNEGDEILIGRTALRFTTEPPPPHLARVSEPNIHAGIDKRNAKMQTVFMGALQARERVKKRDFQRIGMVSAAVATAIALLGLVLLR